MTVLLAVGQPDLVQILRNSLNGARFEVADNNVLHRNYLNELVEQEQPSILILHDRFLPHDCETAEAADAELLRMIEQWRVKYDERMRIVFLCERERKDPFLANLVARNVLDIFNQRVLPTIPFIEQLSEQPKYSNVAKFGIGGLEAIFDANDNSVMDGVSPTPHTLPDVESPLPKHEQVAKRSLEIIERLSEKARPITITKTKTIEVERETVRHVYQTIPSKVILVGGLYSGTGSTLLASNLALMLAKRNLDVSLVEYPKMPSPYLFDHLQIYNKDEEQPYQELCKELKEEKVPGGSKYLWNDRGVKWNVVDTRKSPILDFTYEDMLKMCYTIHSSYLIVDVSNCWTDEAVKRFLPQADFVLMCADTDPIKLDRMGTSLFEYQSKEFQNIELLKKRVDDERFILIQTKFYEGFDSEYFDEVLPKTPLVRLPYIPYWEYQEAVLKEQFLYEDDEYQLFFEEELKPLLQELVPKELISLPQQGKGLFRLLRGRKKRIKT